VTTTINGRLAQGRESRYAPSLASHDLLQDAMPTVYLIAQPTVKRDGGLPDLTPLSEYGEVKVLINSGEYPALHPERCLDLISTRLEKFDQERDFICWAGGDTLAAVFAGIVLERMQMTRVRWLKFQRGWGDDGDRDPNKSYYREVSVPLFNDSLEESHDNSTE
jgi:hypothetical protein